MPNRNRGPQRGSFQQGYGQRPSRQAEQFQQDSEEQYGESDSFARRTGPSQYEEGYARDSRPYERNDEQYRDRGFGPQNRLAGREDYDPLGDYDRASMAARPHDYSQANQTHSYFRADDYGGDNYSRSGFSGGSTRPSQMRGYGQSSSGSYGRSDERGFFDKAGDEISSWFGDDEAARRRKMDHRGRGPANYQRSDERLLEDACERLTHDPLVDATNINVTVADKEVTLDGTVSHRSAKRRAEDCVDDISGVKHVQNNLRVVESDSTWGSGDTGRSPES